MRACLAAGAVSDMIQTGLAWLAEKRAAFAAKACTLTAGQTNYALRATLAKRQVEVSGEGGATLIVEIMTAIVPTADLGSYRPKNGDRLTGTGIDFEVRAPSAGARAWEWSDAHKTAVRLFLRERNAEHAAG